MNTLLIRALRSQGFRKICKGQPSDFSVGGNAFSVNLMSSTLIGLVIFAVQLFGWPVWLPVVIILGSLVVLAVLIAYAGLSTRVVYLSYLIAWFTGGAYLAFKGHFEVLAATHLLPFGIVLGFVWIRRAVQLAGHVPLFIPLALIIVLLPLLTEDPWRLATAAGPRIALLAAISVLPLAVLLIRRIVRLGVYESLHQAADRIKVDPSPEDRAFIAIEAVRDNAREEKIPEEATKNVLRRAYANIPASSVDEAAQAAGRALRWKAIRKLSALVLGVSLAVWLLIYGLAWAAMPLSLASEWSKQAIPVVRFDVLGGAVVLPIGPYVLVAGLLATVACVGFLGFAQTEDQYSEALWNAVVNRTAEDYLLVALPYLMGVDRDATTSQVAQRGGSKSTTTTDSQRPKRKRN